MNASCQFTDAILAHFLDGDTLPIEIEVDGWVNSYTADELAAHRGDCDECALAMASARRLDALVASSTDTDLDDDVADAWFATVAQRFEPTETVPERGARRWWLPLGAAACVAAGYVFSQLLHSPPETAPMPEPVIEPEIVEVVPQQVLPPPPRDLIALPRRSPRAPSEVRGRATPRVASPSEVDTACVANAWMRAVALGLPRTREQLRADAEVASADLKVDAFQRLLAGDSRRALPAIAARVAGWRGEGLDEVVDAVRNHVTVVSRLGSAVVIADDEMLAAAAIVGGSTIDRRIRRRVRGDLAESDAVVGAMTRVTHRPGRAALIVRLFEELRVRGAIADEFELAVQWFVPQPASCTSELVELLRRSRGADDRRICMLGLAARADASASEALIEVVEGASQDDALLAAFALGQFESGADDLDARPLRREYLRVTALACRRDAEVAARLAAMRLSLEEHLFLLAGGFNEQQFKIAASLFRGRRGHSSLSDE